MYIFRHLSNYIEYFNSERPNRKSQAKLIQPVTWLVLAGVLFRAIPKMYLCFPQQWKGSIATEDSTQERIVITSGDMWWSPVINTNILSLGVIPNAQTIYTADQLNGIVILVVWKLQNLILANILN